MWDQRYSKPGYAYGTEPNDFLRAEASRLHGSVLSLGEGEGRNGVFLASLGLDVTGVDGSAIGLEKARTLATTRGVRLHTVLADLASWDPGVEAWDGMVSIWCHLPPELRRTVHRRVVRGLRPGGVFLLEAYTPRQLQFGTGGPPSAAMMYDAATLREDLAGLNVVHAEERDRVVHEGELHEGMSAVVQLVAVKPR